MLFQPKVLFFLLSHLLSHAMPAATQAQQVKRNNETNCKLFSAHLALPAATQAEAGDHFIFSSLVTRLVTGLMITCNASSHSSKHVKVTKSAIPSFNNKMILPCQQPLKQGQGKVMNDDEACDHLLYQQPLKQSKY